MRRLYPALGMVMMAVVALLHSSCRNAETPAPQNYLQYQRNGFVNGRITGRSLEATLADTFRLEAQVNGLQSAFYRDTLSYVQVRDTGTGPFLERKLQQYWRFSINRFDPVTASSLQLDFPLWRRTDDTAASFLGVAFMHDIRQPRTDSVFLNLQGRVSSRPLQGYTLDPEARVTNVVWDSAAGTLRGTYNYRFMQSRNLLAPPTDTAFFSGTFNVRVNRVVR